MDSSCTILILYYAVLCSGTILCSVLCAVLILLYTVLKTARLSSKCKCVWTVKWSTFPCYNVVCFVYTGLWQRTGPPHPFLHGRGSCWTAVCEQFTWPSSTSGIDLQPVSPAIIIEGSIAMDDLQNPSQAMCLLFGLCYGLNLSYPKAILGSL